MISTYRLAMILSASVAASFAAPVGSAQQFPESAYQQLHWRSIGPLRGGRTRAATGVPGQPNVFYIGQVNGGVWKSTDYGRTWDPIFDSQPTQSIGAIAVAPSDPNIVYVASGEGLQRPDLSVGDGIYKSIDAGKTWTHLGLRDGEQIPALAIDPRDPNHLYAAVLGHPYGPSTERGIFASTDGGQNWTKIFYKDENTGGSDVVIDSANPDTLYASMWEVRQGPWEDGNEYNGTGGGLFKSTDGGHNWRQVSNGLPPNIAQIYVAISPSQPSRLYATLATSNRSGAYGSASGLGVYRSDDAGENWSRITDDPRPALRIGGGDLPVPKVDPKNPDVVYSASIVTMHSEDGGKTWTGIRGAPGGDDYQNLWINPDNPNVILLVSDQGAIVTVNRGETWSSWYNQSTAQLYHVGVSNDFPYRVCSGQQESGSACVLSRGGDGEITFRDWRPVGVIEYGYAAPDPLDSDLIYGAGRTEVSKFRWSTHETQDVTPIAMNTGKFRADRTQPILFSPIDPHILYYAANVLFKTTNGGQSWEIVSTDLSRPQPGIPASLGQLADKDQNAGKQHGAIYSLALSFSNTSTIWAGTDDGLIWKTLDAGKNWSNITPPDLTPWSKVTQLEASHFDDHSAYASVSRFRIDDLHPYIYRTHDGGKTWKPIVTGIPVNAPVNAVREDPGRKGLLFAATEKSVWVSFNDGDSWQPLQLNLPHTSMRDLWIHDADLIVATHGRGFWILDDISPLRQISDATLNAPAHLFAPASAYRVERDTNTDTPVPPDEPTAQNPPDGAVIDYTIAHDASAPLTLEILDAQGKLVRRYSSDDKPAISEDELKKQLIPLYWIRMPRTLSPQAGVHRWVWDLRYPAPVSNRHEYPISAVPHDTPRYPLGPRAVPGKYTVRLTVDGQSYSQPLTVKLDPRVKVPAGALEQQLQIESRLAAVMTRSAKAVEEAQSARDQLQSLSAKSTGSVADAVKSAQAKLTSVLGAPGGFGGGGATPGAEPTLNRVNGQVGQLYNEVDRADAAPTLAQSQAAAALERDSAAAAQRWTEFKSSLPGLNSQLRDANLPEIRIEPAAQTSDDSSEDLE